MLSSRPYTPADYPNLCDLLLRYRGGGFVHRYPTLWRLKVLLTSRLWNMEQDTRVWEYNGQLIGFAFLWKRRVDHPVCVLERILFPPDTALTKEMFAWAIARLEVYTAELGTPTILATTALEASETEDRAVIESAGLSSSEGGRNIYMACELNASTLSLSTPHGVSLAPLTETDLLQYQQIYGFTAVALDHRRELLHEPEYSTWLAKADNGTIQGYIELSYWRTEWERSGQRVAWIDYIETAEAYHGRGIGRALMAVGFRQMQAWGAQTAMLITADENAAAQNLYQAVGMSVVAREPLWLRKFG